MFTYRVDDDITLELQAPEQVRALFAVISANREHLGRHLQWANRIHEFSDMDRFMQRDLLGMVGERRWAWLIRYQGQVAGRIGLFVTIPEVKECELNYWLAKAMTGKGIITRAARAIIDHAFTELGMRHILIGCAPDNPRSCAVAERLGLKREFTLRDNESRAEGFSDVHFYGIMRDEWQIDSHPIFTHELGDTLHLRLQEPRYAKVQFDMVLQNSEDIQRWFSWMNKGHTLEAAQAHTIMMLKGYASAKNLLVGIWHEEEFAGSASLDINSNAHSAHVGYLLDKDHRGKGVMTRTVRALMAYAFEVRGLQCFYLRAATENSASRAVAERLAMTQEAILRHDNFVAGRWLNLVQYSLLADEWQQAKVRL